VGLYFTIFSLFIYLILTFIPQLIANALAPFIIGAVRKLDGVKKVIEVFDAIQDQISGALTSIFAAMGQSGSFSITNFGLDALTAVIALVLYVLVFFLLAAILMLTMIICYFIFANKLKSAKINKYVSKLVGGVFGAFIAIFYASTSAMLLSMPIFDYSSQRFGVPITPGVDNSGRFIDSVKNGNQYSRYALSGQFNNVIPAGAITLSYSSSCAFKYIVAPIISGMTALQNMVANEGDQAANLQEAFGGFTDTVISGYASNNILDLPVKQCIQVLPIETQNFVRMFTEFIMNASILTSISNTNVNTANIGQAGIMFNQMDHYKVEKKLAPEYRFDQKTFIDFFNWSKTQPEGNQFLRSVAVLNAKKGSAALQSIFSNGESAYSFHAKRLRSERPHCDIIINSDSTFSLNIAVLYARTWYYSEWSIGTVIRGNKSGRRNSCWRWFWIEKLYGLHQCQIKLESIFVKFPAWKLTMLNFWPVSCTRKN
jgi:hypothetical protein